MPVEIGELSMPEFRVDLFPYFIQEVDILTPQPANGRAFRIAQADCLHLFCAQLAPILRIHNIAVCLIVPPDETKIAQDHAGAWVYVTDHALAGRDGVSKLVLDRMARLILGYRRVCCLALSHVTIL